VCPTGGEFVIQAATAFAVLALKGRHVGITDGK
jgi:hypothetical protein